MPEARSIPPDGYNAERDGVTANVVRALTHRAAGADDESVSAWDPPLGKQVRLSGGIMHRRHVAWFAGALFVFAIGLPTSPAAATVVSQPFAGSDSSDYSDCGYPVHVESTFHGVARIRVGKNQDESVF